MIRAALLLIAYVGLVLSMIAVAAIHHVVSFELFVLVMTLALAAGFALFVDETRQQRRKWRDHPNRRNGIFKDWK